MKKHRFLLSFSFFLLASSWQVILAQDPLEFYLNVAAENNPALKSTFNEYHAALERVPQVGTLPDPMVSFGYFIQPVETRVGPQQARISASQMFPWFGTLKSREKTATLNAKAKYENFLNEKSSLFYQVKSGYYNLFFTGRSIEIMRQNIELLRSFLRLSNIKVESGQVSGVDQLRVEIEIADLENQLDLLLDRFETQEINFRNLLNVDDNYELTIVDSMELKDLPLEPEIIMDSILNNNHELIQTTLLSESYEYQQKTARKKGLPSFNLGVDYMVIGESINPMISSIETGKDAIVLPTVGISIPLYRKKYNAMVQEAIFLEEAQNFKKKEKINLLENQFQKVLKEYADAKRRIELYQKQTELAERALNILETKYATNNKNFEELLRMERQLLSYQLGLVKAKTEVNSSIAFMNYLMGNLYEFD